MAVLVSIMSRLADPWLHLWSARVIFWTQLELIALIIAANQ